MRNVSNPETQLNSNDSNRRIRGLKIVTAVSLIAFVSSIIIFPIFLVQQKTQIRNLMQKLDNPHHRDVNENGTGGRHDNGEWIPRHVYEGNMAGLRKEIIFSEKQLEKLDHKLLAEEQKNRELLDRLYS